MSELEKIATQAGLSPTFINWFSDHPEIALGELWKWWSLKNEVIEVLSNNSIENYNKITDSDELLE